MIDIHNHLLFGVDDGADDIYESFEMVKAANEIGYHSIVATPHYISNSDFSSNLYENNKKFNELKNHINQKKLEVELMLGNEVYFDTDLAHNLENNVVSTLNKTRYVLLETPRNKVVFKNLLNFIFQLQVYGYIIILAHPERYDFVYSNINVIKELIDRDVLIQMNLSSIVGYYGKTVKETAIKLLDYNMVHFVGSDAHSVKHYEKIDEALDVLKKRVGQRRFQEQVESNAKIILSDGIFYPEKPSEIKKKSIFNLLKRQK
ncbi:MAG: tyrosine-protein phosphatase [Eubacteriaceae bacterium]